ncbi:putative LRR receptor-like serine/threonine-protein kinase [Forsythia ovata]|uniref:LRR receptor-like serine/threonine-protein kinase n=1 Tax=Forsythia ovata TaxID=205694 RepID=A0ABD1U5P2_9LAMI
MGLGGTIAKEIGGLFFLRSMIISNNNFHGFIPDEMGKLSQLREIEMQYNELNGAIPTSLGFLDNLQKLNLSYKRFNGNIPNGIFNLSSLVEISFGNNSISGSLPKDICYNLPKLEMLRISVNQISGNIPPSLGTCTNLKLLSLSYNNFAGSIPMEIGKLSKLQILYLARNNLIVPYSIGSLSNLKELNIGINHLHGQTPQSIFNLSMLQRLGIVYNNISGNLPSSVANRLHDLKSLFIGVNRLSGEIPGSNGLPDLKSLFIGVNRLSGEIPGCISNLSKLNLLDLSDNSFNGRVPMNLGNLQNLQLLAFDGNQLSNDTSMLELNFLISLINCRQLKKIRIGRNSFDGMLLRALGNLSASIEVFTADFCGFKGIVPNEIGNMSNLIELGIGGNELTGTIPNTLGQLTKTNKDIQIIDPSYNFLNGSLALEIGSVKGLRELYLSRNQFSGEIPSIIGQLQNLVNLILSSNLLHSPIPELLGNMIALQYLDLSKNNLSGEIPRSLEKLKDLMYFNFSFNELSGEIPNGGSFKNLTADFFVGNSKLCGASQYKVMPCKCNATSSSSNSRTLKYILLSIALVIILAIILVYLMSRRNRNTLLPDQSTFSITVKRISYYEVLNATNKFGEENLIGRGSIGKVYNGIFSDGMIAAIKVFNLDLASANKSFDTECHILCNIPQRNLVKVITSCSNLDLKALVLEYMPNGNLNKWLLEIMIDVACALEYLHHGYLSPIVHCDLKPSNILLDEDMVAHVADFGIAKLFTEDQRISLTKTLGTIGYMALVENNGRAEEICFRSIMGLALECTTDLPEERLSAKDVLTRLKKIKTEFC